MARTERAVLKTTSSRSKCANPKGFTLIEILIVLAIITLIMSVGLPALERVTYQRLNSTTRRFVGTIREIRNDAILLNTVHRLAINFDEKSWWVESQKEFKLLQDSEQEVTKAGRKSKEPPPSNFVIEKKYSSKPIALPDGVVFDGVLKERGGLTKEGTAYIHFFPNGFNDFSILYLNKEGSKGAGYSLVLRPTAGKAEIHAEKITSFEALR
ncbi:MAG: prepilin-type N-terminal cleavage/methylation domain-containing protein [Deltaproteobacteria bacterium]|nr:prepilin-type N-terminal cleavage/methylation domain-containing protein [Deltaproteobacteria bacterium]